MSQIDTRSSLVFQACENAPAAEDAAQHVGRYMNAVHNYLLRITRDHHAAADLAQEFALRFLRGDFRRAEPRRGRFRDFLKTSILHMAIDAHRRKLVQPRNLPDHFPEPAAPAFDLSELDREFFDCWRNELLDLAWKELARHEERTGQPFHTVLRFRADHPEMHSPEIAERLSGRLAMPVNAGWVRQSLLRARKKYVELIVAEVAASLTNPSDEQVDEELRNLDLWDYCRANRPCHG